MTRFIPSARILPSQCYALAFVDDLWSLRFSLLFELCFRRLEKHNQILLSIIADQKNDLYQLYDLCDCQNYLYAQFHSLHYLKRVLQYQNDTYF